MMFTAPCLRHALALFFLVFLPLFALAQPANNDASNATTIAMNSTWMYADMDGATMDYSQGYPCIWGSGSGNIWFTFQATSSYVRLSATRTDFGGECSVSLHTGWSSLGCVTNRDNNNVDPGFSYNGLTVGNWYYVAVATDDIDYDTYIHLTISDAQGNDFRTGATTLPTYAEGWCSSNTAYNNTTHGGYNFAGASNAHINGISHVRNAWFRFQVPSVQTVGVRVMLGTLARAWLTLYDDAGNLLVSRYGATGENPHVVGDSLQPGQWYYIAVDRPEYEEEGGTFGLCFIPPNNDHFKDAMVLENTLNWCSAGHEFSNAGATNDGPGTMCSNTNRTTVWFKFKAVTHYIDINRP